MRDEGYEGYEELLEFERSSVTIDPADLNKEFTELPSVVGYWNARLTEATEDFMHAKRNLDYVRARVLLAAKDDARLTNNKLTVGEFDAIVQVDQDVISAHRDLIEKEVERHRIKGIVGAVLVKKDMLQMLGSKLRVEMESDPILREQMAGMSSQYFGSK